MYLVTIMDWYSRYVLAWALSNTLERYFCLEALTEALRQGKPKIFNNASIRVWPIVRLLKFIFTTAPLSPIDNLLPNMGRGDVPSPRTPLPNPHHLSQSLSSHSLPYLSSPFSTLFCTDGDHLTFFTFCPILTMVVQISLAITFGGLDRILSANHITEKLLLGYLVSL